MQNLRLINFLQALLVFILAVAIRASIVDRIYQYSFEADSEACVEETRSFYFFFKNPSKENIPHQLSSYPTYFDGDYIVSAAFANMVRPLCRGGIIDVPLSDSDNSLTIFSMRWASVLLDALAAVMAFVIVLLLTRRSVVALIVTVCYYLLNTPTLHTDLMRVDHFTLFAGNLALLSAVLLAKYPSRKVFYVLAGLAAGMVSGTKINFPFYLAPLVLVGIVLLFKRKVSVLNFVITIFSLLFMLLLMFHRWRLYPENIVPTITDILKVGEEWFGFWGNGNRYYYFWDVFFPHGFSPLMLVGLVTFYGSFIYTSYRAITQRDWLKALLCFAFTLQIIALMFSPKVERYGIILPLWMVIFIGCAVSDVLNYYIKKQYETVAKTFIILVMLHVFIYQLNDYLLLKEQRITSRISVLDTRLKPMQWIKEHVPLGSIIAIQSPHVSNPPVFDLPYIFEEHYLTHPFLSKQEFADFHPPAIDILKRNVDYVIISDKERDFETHLFGQYQLDGSIIREWGRFYDSLQQNFQHVDFTSPYTNYGLSAIHIYEMKRTADIHLPVLTATNSVREGKIILKTEINPIPDTSALKFQIQIGFDSTMRWLLAGSRDSYVTKYRPLNGKVLESQTASAIPSKIMEAIALGKFDKVMGNHKDLPKSEIEKFFRNLLLLMAKDSLSVQESLSHMLPPDMAATTSLLIDGEYGSNGKILSSRVAAYLDMVGLPANSVEMAQRGAKLIYRFEPSTKFANGKTYYWRIRLRNKTQVLSNWSNIDAFEIE